MLVLRRSKKHRKPVHGNAVSFGSYSLAMYQERVLPILRRAKSAATMHWMMSLPMDHVLVLARHCWAEPSATSAQVRSAVLLG